MLSQSAYNFWIRYFPVPLTEADWESIFLFEEVCRVQEQFSDNISAKIDGWVAEANLKFFERFDWWE